VSRFLLTMQREENFMLPVFLDHYARYFPEDCIFVIDHGSRVPANYPGVNRLAVPATRGFSELDRLRLIKSMVNGLLGYFDYGVFADCDELIAMEYVDESVLGRHGVLNVAGFEVYRDRPGQLLGLLSPFMCKPLIFKTQPNWNVGFHLAVGVEPPERLTVPMAHIRFLDTGVAAKRLATRPRIREAMPEREQQEGLAIHWSQGHGLLENFQRRASALAVRDAPIVAFEWVDRGTVMQPQVLSAQPGSEVTVWAPRGGYELAAVRHDLSSAFPHLM
jgi:hypothetical protein